MPPTIHFVRHAQGYHNLSHENEQIHDPLLTPYGEQQCTLLSQTFPYTDSIDLLVASPLKRTVWTALRSFPTKAATMRLVAVPEFQETSDNPCDTGSARAELEREFAGRDIDWSLVVDGWNSKKGNWAPDRTAIEARCLAARQWLAARPEAHIVVVTHGGVLHYLTEDWIGHASAAGTGWANTEYRSYTFVPNSARTSLAETDESRTRRRGTEKPPSAAEQRNIAAPAVKEREKYGSVQAKANNDARRESVAADARARDRDWIDAYGA